MELVRLTYKSGTVSSDANDFSLTIMNRIQRGAQMRTKLLNRVISSFLTIILLCISVPAQLEFGGRSLGTARTSHLRSQTRLRIGVRRPSFVFRVGGVAFDGVAIPAADLSIRQLGLNYARNNKDGERLSLTFNGQKIAAPIYDWQLIPIAKFANSDDVACFTLTGDYDPSDGEEQFAPSLTQYQESFQDEVLGVRLFQLDRFFFDNYYWDLVMKDGKYLLAAGEAMPDFEANKKALAEFKTFKEQQRDILDFESYIISDYDRTVSFNVREQQLQVGGEPSIYFWTLNEDALADFYAGTTGARMRKKLEGEAGRRSRVWLISQITKEQNQYIEVLGNSDIGFERSDKLLSALQSNGRDLKKTVLNRMRISDLADVLVELRTFNSIDWVSEVKPLSQKFSSETQRIRAMNPLVWDAAVVLMRYAAFFRYCKQNYPQEWKNFMEQIAVAPRTAPRVETPTSIGW
jgi:hypothetical protein